MAFPMDLILDPEIDSISASLEVAAREIEALNELADEAGVMPLDAFLDASSSLGLDPDAEEDGEDMHDPATGLATVQALIAAVEANPGAVRKSLEVLRELREMKAALNAARKAGSRFCLAMDL